MAKVFYNNQRNKETAFLLSCSEHTPDRCTHNNHRPRRESQFEEFSKKEPD